MINELEYLEKQFPEVFHTWHIVREIGRGSFGEVYEVQRESIGMTETAALKHISYPQDQYDMQRICTNLGTTDEAALRKDINETVSEIRREYEMMRKFSGQSNIVSCEDFQAFPKKDMPGYDIFIRMEKLTAVSELMMAGPMEQDDVIRLGIDICSALELLEEEGVIHRDIKPENLFVNDLGNFKLGDFGAARTLSSKGELLSVKGTPAYMAPEIAMQKEAGPWTDIYSLGLVLYRLLNNNQPPFVEDGRSASTRIQESASSRRLAGEKLNPPCSADPALAAVVLKACAFDRKERYRTAAEFKKALSAVSSEGAKARKKMNRKEEASLQREKGFRVFVTTQEDQAELDRQRKEKEAAEQAAAAERAQKEKEEKKKKKKKTAIIAAACVLVLAAAGVAGILIKQNAEKKERYDTAVELLEKGRYEEAEREFTDLGNYSDAADKAGDARKSARLRDGRDAMDAGDPASLSKAQVIFEELKGFGEADELLAETNRRINKAARLKEADALMEKADGQHGLGSAESLETALENYRSAQAIYADYREEDPEADGKAALCEDWEEYIRAEQKFAEPDYQAALAGFKKLANRQQPFEDAAVRVQEVQKAELLSQAEAILASEEPDYDEAIRILESDILADDSAAEERKAEAEALRTEAELSQKYKAAQELLDKRQYLNAASAFGRLRGYQDASLKRQYALGLKALLQDRDYGQADRIFTRLTEQKYLDAEDLAKQARNEDKLKKGFEALEAGKAGDKDKLAEAKRIFNDLENFTGDYGSAKTLADEAISLMDKNDRMAEADQIVQTAREQHEKGSEIYLDAAIKSYQKAAGIYSKFSNSDQEAANREAECNNWVSYIEAEMALNRAIPDFETARFKFDGLAKQIPPFEDAEDRLHEVDVAEQLAKADALYNEKNYKDAIREYNHELLADNQQAAERKETAQKYLDFQEAERIRDEDKDYQKAADEFHKLGTFNEADKEEQYALGLKALLTDRDYNQADEIFSKLAKQKYAGAEDLAKQARNEDKLKKGFEALEAGKAGDKDKLAEAKRILNELENFTGDYGSAKTLADETLNLMDKNDQMAEADQIVQTAREQHEKGSEIYLDAAIKSYQKAAGIYSKFSNSDQEAANREAECNNWVSYIEAEMALNRAIPDFETARFKFDGLAKQIPPFEDAEDRLHEVDVAEQLAKADALYNEKNYKDAIREYNHELLADNQQAAERKETAQKYLDFQEAERIRDEDKDYQKAADEFHKLGTFNEADKAEQHALGLKALYEDLNYDLAEETFNNLKGYLDGTRLLQEAAEKKGIRDKYNQAVASLNQPNPDYKNAGILLAAVLEFEENTKVLTEMEHMNAEALAEECEEHLKYQQALELMKESDYKRAYEILKDLYLVEEAPEKAEECLFGQFCYDASGMKNPGKILTSCYRYVYDQMRENPDGGLIWAKSITPEQSRRNGGAIATAFAKATQFTDRGMTPDQNPELLARTLCDVLLAGRATDYEFQECFKFLKINMTVDRALNYLVNTSVFRSLCAEDGFGIGDVEYTTESRDRNYQVTRFVYDCYMRGLGRPAEAGGLNLFTSLMLDQNETPKDIMLRIGTSWEATHYQDGTGLERTDEDYVRLLYLLVMGRPATDSDIALQARELKKGVSKEELARRLMDPAQSGDECDNFLKREYPELVN